MISIYPLLVRPIIFQPSTHFFPATHQLPTTYSPHHLPTIYSTCLVGIWWVDGLQMWTNIRYLLDIDGEFIDCMHALSWINFI